MFGRILFLLSILTFIHGLSQSNDLSGKWILDRMKFNNGNNLEINDPFYSSKFVYEIKPKSLKINGNSFPAKFSAYQMKTQFRTMNYVLKDHYLIIQDEKDDKISFFLKANDFIRKYPEFAVKQTMRNSDSVYIANNLSDYEFENELSLEEFIEMNRREKNRTSSSFSNLHFAIEFVLTNDNKISDIKVLNSIDAIYDNDYIRALRTAEKYFRNLTGKDLLISLEQDHLKWSNDLIDKDEKQLYALMAKGLNFYNLNEFDKAIETFSQTENLQIKNNRFKTLIKEAFIKLGISYLAVGKNEEACRVFKKVGDKTDFEVRNYLIDFCQKN